MKKIFVLASTLFVSSIANANLLDFSGNICNGACVNGSKIENSYGDIAGQLDVVYNSNISLPPSDVITDRRLQYWDMYSNLNSVAWGTQAQTVEIFLNPLNGSLVTLNSVDFASYLSADRSSQFSVLDGLNNVLFSSGVFNLSTDTQSFFLIGLSSINGLRLQFGPDAFNVGIDNINYTLSNGDTPNAVPLPAAAWLFGSGIMGLFGLRRRALA